MNENRRKLAIWILATLLFQGSVYLYLDKVLLAPTSSYQVSAMAETVTGGKAYYSRDRRYTAIVKNDTVEIYAAGQKEPARTIGLGRKRVSYFRWLDDRDLALMAVYEDGVNATEVTLTQVQPQFRGHELSETVSKLPRGSKITDVAFSTATNVVFMLVQMPGNPDQYRVYRTDANKDLKRVYLNSSRIGRIAVLYDRDTMYYDSMADGIVTARHGDGSWEVVSPAVGKYRLVGVDAGNNVYIAQLNKDGMATKIFVARPKGKFTEERVLQTPMDVNQLTVKELGKAAH